MRLAKLLILSTCLTELSLSAQAQTCAPRPSCESLGYNKTAEECNGKRTLLCPFDTTKFYCVGSLCPSTVTCSLPSTCKTECANACVECETPDRGEFFDGRGNTAKIIAQIGNNGLAATACNQFYPPEVSANDANFGAGKWHLPAIGELIKMYGLNVSLVTSDEGNSGSDTSKGFSWVNASLKAANGSTLSSTYQSSSEGGFSIWTFITFNGSRGVNDAGKGASVMVRCFQLLKNLFNPSSPDDIPKIGDIMLSDKTWNNTTISGKTPIGVVVDVYGTDVTIINLKDLTFLSYTNLNNFNAASPYTNNSQATQWATDDYAETNITALKDYTSILSEIQAYQYW